MLSMGMVIIGAAFYCYFVGPTMWISLWKSFVWLIAPDGGVEEDSTAGAAMGAILSIGGLMMFAMFLAILQETFVNYLDTLREGRSPVMEQGHVLLIGITDATLDIVQ